MSNERSDKLYEYWLQASQKFDYFVTGVCLALISYLANTLRPIPIGLNSNTLLLLATICLLAAALSGLRQIEATVTLLQVMHSRIYKAEVAGNLISAAAEGGMLINRQTGDLFTPQDAAREGRAAQAVIPSIEKTQEKWASSAHRWYRWRNRFLLIGLTGVLVSKVVAGYGR